MSIFSLRRKRRRLPDATLKLRIAEKMARYKARNGLFEDSRLSEFEIEGEDTALEKNGVEVQELDYEQMSLEDRRIVSVAFGRGINVVEMVNPDPWKGNDD